jgi:hypothetical protein
MGLEDISFQFFRLSLASAAESALSMGDYIQRINAFFYVNQWYCYGCSFWRLCRGRCYDHNFLRFSTFFGEKIGVFGMFSKTNVIIKILHTLALF